ncbi:hypothetical protein RDV64_19810 [Acuticoccus sp. MNP-M23]|uniref:hypothetical protein n=1 Tax=Acuticoccus sp. MNP-M23 TaxID=3072793 RepID=UPI00281694BF|nr:hypothetical protein [Acuticoccus sp. MNP-M23]WMS42284.1 hypothetical protein RDV64_19810 [Acuticoccus sp. MNP-M23]
MTDHSFDGASAKFVKKSGLHNIYKDEHGSRCLVASRRGPGDGVFVNSIALSEIDANDFVRLISEAMDRIVMKADLPEKEERDGRRGAFRLYEPEDFDTPPYPAEADDTHHAGTEEQRPPF